MVATSLVNNLRYLRDNKLYSCENQDDENYEYDVSNTQADSDLFCFKVDVVFNLAGVNRMTNPEEIKAGNFGFSEVKTIYHAAWMAISPSW